MRVRSDSRPLHLEKSGNTRVICLSTCACPEPSYPSQLLQHFPNVSTHTTATPTHKAPICANASRLDPCMVMAAIPLVQAVLQTHRIVVPSYSTCHAALWEHCCFLGFTMRIKGMLAGC
jgi:hypothetical protein